MSATHVWVHPRQLQMQLQTRRRNVDKLSSCWHPLQNGDAGGRWQPTPCHRQQLRILSEGWESAPPRIPESQSPAFSTQHPKPRAQDPESWLQVQLLSVVEGKGGAESHMLSLVARQALRSLSCLVFSSVCSLCLPQCVGYTERNLKPIQKLARQPRKSLEFENLFKICLKVCYKNSFFDL